MPDSSDRFINAAAIAREKSGNTRMYLPPARLQFRSTSWFDDPSLHWLVNRSAGISPPMSAARGAARRPRVRRAVAFSINGARELAGTIRSLAARLPKIMLYRDEPR